MLVEGVGCVWDGLCDRGLYIMGVLSAPCEVMMCIFMGVVVVGMCVGVRECVVVFSFNHHIKMKCNGRWNLTLS